MPSTIRALEKAVLQRLSRVERVRLVINQIPASRDVYEVCNVLVRAFLGVLTFGIVETEHLEEFFDCPRRI